MATEDQEKIDADALAQIEADDAKGWEDAAGAFIAEKGAAIPVETPKVNEDKKEEKTDEEKKAESEAAEQKRVEEAEAEKAKGETPEQTEARHKKEAEDKAAAEKIAQDNPADTKVVRDQRALQREIEADRKQTLEDVKAKVFDGLQTRLEDDEGNEITTIEQLQEMKNPRTGKAFTDEEAAAYLMAAGKHYAKVREDNEARAEKIADLNIQLKDDLDDVRSEYAEILKGVPGLGKKLWEQYQKLLTIDKDKELIVDSSMSFREFADMQLAPYQATLDKIDAEEAAEAKKAEAAAEAKKQEKKEEKKRDRSDRSDIFGGTGKSKLGGDQEEDDWAKAAKEYYEG